MGPVRSRRGPTGTTRRAARGLRGADGERGSILILTALLLPVVLAVTALGLETLALTGSQREMQHAAELAALRAAANRPLVDVGVGGLLDGTEAEELACPAAEENLEAGTLLPAFNAGPSLPSCAAGVAVSTEADSATLTSALGLVGTVLPLVDVADLLPAAVTPNVRTTITAQVETPMRGLISDAPATVEAEAIARRRFKNLVILPVVESTPLCDLLTAPLALLGLDGALSGLLSLTGCHVDANTLLDGTDDPAWDALDGVAGALPGDLGTLTCGFKTDAQDLLEVGPSGPKMQDIIDAAAENDEDVLVAIVGASAIPILDFVPVAATDLQAAINPGDSTAEVALAVRSLPGATNSIADAQGIFRASLVTEPGGGC